MNAQPPSDPPPAAPPRASAVPFARRGGDLDELFGVGEGAARPRTGLVLALVAAGLVLAVVGMTCTPAVGAVLVLLGLYVAEKESARVESGYLPVSERSRVVRVRGLAVAAVVVVVVLFLAQLTLLSFGVYNDLWLGAVDQLAAWKEQVYPTPDPPPTPPPDPAGPSLRPPPPPPPPHPHP